MYTCQNFTISLDINDVENISVILQRNTFEYIRKYGLVLLLTITVISASRFWPYVHITKRADLGHMCKNYINSDVSFRELRSKYLYGYMI